MTAPSPLELKPCPFCNDKLAVISHPVDRGMKGGAGDFVEHLTKQRCPLACMSIPLAMWQRRAQDNAAAQELNHQREDQANRKGVEPGVGVAVRQTSLIASPSQTTDVDGTETNRGTVAEVDGREPAAAAPSPPAPEKDADVTALLAELDGLQVPMVFEYGMGRPMIEQSEYLKVCNITAALAAALRRSGSASVPATKEQICRHGRNTYVDDCGLCERFGDDAPASGMAEQEGRWRVVEQNDRRYRWLRDKANRRLPHNKHYAGDICVWQWEDRSVMNMLCSDALDTAIDAALSETSEGGKDG